jgi:hypothetical protein
MLNKELKLNLILGGECLYFLNLVRSDTAMEFEEIFSKMIELYKFVYFSQYELALVEGDTIIKKLNIEDLKRKSS